MEDNAINFEEAIKRLEELVRLMESGNLSLEESLKSFEEGIGFIRICNDRLGFFEKKVQSLIELTVNTGSFCLPKEGVEQPGGSATILQSENN